MDLKEIRKFIAENKDNDEVKAYLSEVRKDGLMDYLKSDEGFKEVKPFVDSKITKALETYKKESVPKLIDDALNSKVPELEEEFKKKWNVKDPDDPVVADLKKKYEELTAKADKAEREKSRLEKLTKVKDVLNAKGLAEHSELFLGETVDESIEKATNFLGTFDKLIQTNVDRIIGEGKYNPNNGKGTDGKKKFTDTDVKNMSDADYEKNRTEILGITGDQK